MSLRIRNIVTEEVIRSSGESDLAKRILELKADPSVSLGVSGYIDMAAQIVSGKHNDDIQNLRLPSNFIGSISLLQQALEQKNAQLLFKAADTASQKWPDYKNSVLPKIFRLIDRHYSLFHPNHNFENTAYSQWWEGLELMLSDDFINARDKFYNSFQ